MTPLDKSIPIGLSLSHQYGERKEQSYRETLVKGVMLSPELTKQFTCRLYAAAISLLLGRIGRWCGKEIARSTLSLARSAQAERDNESCFFLRNHTPSMCGHAFGRFCDIVANAPSGGARHNIPIASRTVPLSILIRRLNRVNLKRLILYRCDVKMTLAESAQRQYRREGLKIARSTFARTLDPDPRSALNSNSATDHGYGLGRTRQNQM
ncbi:hypothetical protein EVAR_14162_1 [Eumeta japonica]|uniref:Uncharacterized protein n=1 Tax=Eumeta variegata TaxID=151549 RepID=A0A4C1UER5_EUMVA|nr:hypothetical protein EVAR_14162_1 [Eumeta japonica]